MRKNHTILTKSLCFLMFCLFSNAASSHNTKSADKMNVCKVSPVPEPVKINADWNKKPWNETKAENIANYMGDKPDHFPDVQFKTRYDKRNIYVVFQVKDRYVKAAATEIHGRVWEDSCVEFFFSPGIDLSRGYFNLETNCKGIFLLEYGLNNNQRRNKVDLSDCKKITVAHSLTKDASTEIIEPTTWYIEYAIPFEMLNKYIKVDQPSKNVQWRANFFKCGDKTSHPHWLTWNKVINPVPKFHIPQYFGLLEFQ
jgi:hypothetical protein